ncbi:MAG: hypothetical protein ACRETA_08375, partial [Gammaproteobacteria bacterium]
MKFFSMNPTLILLLLIVSASFAHAATVTVGPTGQYPTPCAAFAHLSDNDTVLIDANGGVPYKEGECVINNNDLTISGVNGRPIMDGTGESYAKAMWDVDGHDIVIDNIEFRNVAPGASDNAAALRVESGTTAAPDGGNLIVQRSYIHDCADGILSDNITAPTSAYQWYSATPYITLQYDELYHDGNGGGYDHNTYIGYGGNLDFTLRYSWSHDSNQGEEVKSRATYNNILYDLITDPNGMGNFMMELPQGGSTYIVGTIFERGATSCCNKAFIIWRTPDDDSSTSSPAYGPPNEDLHFINNTVINSSANTGYPDFVNIECYSNQNPCPAPPAGEGDPLTVAPVFENNIFLGATVGGQPQQPTNSSLAILHNNVVIANTAANLAELFVDPTHYDYHLISGAAAIGAGMYPPTDNTGMSDPKALAVYEFVVPTGMVARPAPAGVMMDAGAYSYPRVGTPPTLTLSYTATVAAPNSGSITVSGLPSPVSDQYNDVAFYSNNLSAIPEIPSVAGSSGTVTSAFTTVQVAATTVVPIDVYADGAHATATITVNPGGMAAGSIAVVSGSGQSAVVGTPFANPLVVVVKTASGAAVSGTTVTFAGSGVSFPSGVTAVTNSSGDAQITAQPTAAGALTVTASTEGLSTRFSETGTAAVAGSIAVVSGSAQSAVVGASFANPLVVVVKTTSGAAVSGTTVIFAGSGVSFPSGATAVTNSSGDAQITAQPT